MIKLYANQDMSEPEVSPIAGGRAAVFSTRCPEKETPNEDAAALIQFDEASGVLAVADGLGGGPAGERAARTAIESLSRAVEDAIGTETLLRAAIIDGFEKANLAVQEIGGGAATTMAVLEVRNGIVRPYHVGDSMILITGGRGKIKLQTIAHSPLGYAVESGIVDERDAMHHEERHVVSNVVGVPAMRLELGPQMELSARDSILLATDGLFDNLHVEEIVERLRKGPLLAATMRLVSDSHARMNREAAGQPSKPDDLTLVAFRRTKA